MIFAEEMRRYENFRVNMQKASVLNAIELGTGVYGHSPFADMTGKDFLQNEAVQLCINCFFFHRCFTPSTPVGINEQGVTQR